MTTLLLRLAGPMQSWGTQSRFTARDTGLEPSKSGVVGLICAALGRSRQNSVDDLAALCMGVRVDREGSMKRDYHTAGGSHRKGERYGVAKADGSPGDTVVSHRYYLADADFLVGLEGDISLLTTVQEALARPKWQLFLGRKSFVPGVPAFVPDGFKPDQPVEDALRSYPWPRWDVDLPARLPVEIRFVLEAPGETHGEIRVDQPIGTAFQTRSFIPRCVQTRFFKLGTEVPVRTLEESNVPL